MSENLDNKAQRGSIAPIIITALSSGDKYGYEICKEIERLSGGKLILKQPSLYSSLRRMEEQHLVHSYWKDSELGGNRHYYVLTDEGEKLYEDNKNQWLMEDLISSLPASEYQLNQEETVILPTQSTGEMSVGRQETLFSLSTSRPEIRKIDESQDNEDSKNQSFYQFDLFGQDVKAVSKQNVTQKVEAYTNKYEQLDNHQNEIEPARPLQESEPIVRASIFDVAKRLSAKTQEESITSSSQNISNELSTKPNNETFLGNKKFDNIDENSAEQKASVKNEEISWNEPEKEEPIFENNDYKTVIGNLYNKSQMSDPYEQNRAKTFKEIFPSSQLSEQPKKQKTSEIDDFVEKSSASNIDCNDLSMIANLYKLQGLDVRKHDSEHAKTTSKRYTDKNKLNMYTAWITALFMLTEVIFCYLFLNKDGYILDGQKLVYFLAGACACSVALIFTLENFLNRYRLVVIETKFKREMTKRLLLFLFSAIITFAICLAVGMKDIFQREFLSYWLIPVLVASNIVLSYIVFYTFYKSGKFSY